MHILSDQRKVREANFHKVKGVLSCVKLYLFSLLLFRYTVQPQKKFPLSHSRLIIFIKFNTNTRKRIISHFLFPLSHFSFFF